MRAARPVVTPTPLCHREIQSIVSNSVRIAGICGSLRGQDSYTLKLLTRVMDELERRGAQTDLLDLAHMELPLCKSARDTDDNPATLDLRQRIHAAQGIVLSTPEYHNSYSGVLKNALDLLQYDQMRNKMFGLIGVAGGDMGAINALAHLRAVVRGVGGFCIPQQISLPSVYQHFDGDRLTDPQVRERVQHFAAELKLHSEALAALPQPGP